MSKNLKGYDLEDFVANLLEAMGYRAEVSQHGGDSGIDITAYKDELPPRILVQVKSSDSDIRESTIQSLKGAMREGDYGLFITLANYMPSGTFFDTVGLMHLPEHMIRVMRENGTVSQLRFLFAYLHQN